MKVLMMLFVGICLTLASCDKKDHSDEPGGSTSTENGYGEIKPTGLKIANLYRETYNGDGPKELKIPDSPLCIIGLSMVAISLFLKEAD